MAKDELKPCPFCGNRAKEVQTPGSYGGYHLTVIKCQTCSATASNTEEWNARVAGEEQINFNAYGKRARKCFRMLGFKYTHEIQNARDVDFLGVKGVNIKTVRDIRKTIELLSTSLGNRPKT